MAGFFTRPCPWDQIAEEEPCPSGYGPPAESAAYDCFYKSISHSESSLDFFALSIANHLTLELTYQTRFLGTGHNADAVLFAGDERDFPFVMNNHNVVFGISLTQGHTSRYIVPENVKEDGFELVGELLADVHIESVPEALRMNDRVIIGLVIIDLDSEICSNPNTIAGISLLNRFYNMYTTYLIIGSVQKVCQLSNRISEDKGCVSRLRFYEPRGSVADSEVKAVLLIQGADKFPILRRPQPPRPELVPSRWTFKCVGSKPFTSSEAATHVEYLPYENINTKQPIAVLSNTPLLEELSRHVSRSLHMFHQVAVVPHGWVLPFHGSTYSTFAHATAHGEVITDYGDEPTAITKTPFWLNGSLGDDGVRFSNYPLTEFINIPGAVIPLQFTPKLHYWFSHFMMQCLPRIIILEELGIRDAKIAVPADIRKKQVEMIVACGVDESRIIRIPDDVPWQCDELIVPKAWPLAFSEKTLAIYDRIKFAYRPETLLTRPRILISRQMRKSWRNMINAKNIESMLLENAGFQLVKPETLSLSDEIGLFHNASIVVGAEGAGLYGSCFSSSDCVYVSISDEDYAMPILGSIAHVRGFDIIYVFGESFRSDLDLGRRLPGGHTDFVVNPADVLQAVQSASRFQKNGAL